MTNGLEAQELLSRLISYNTISSRSNLQLICFVADYLESFGFDVIYTYNSSQDKANVFASKGPKNKPGLVLSGHTDVVPVSENDWTSAPFILAERNDRYYGRGTCDMKGFLAAAMFVATSPACQTREAPLHLAFSYDEEVGCLGAPAMIRQLNPAYHKPDRVVVGEPTSLRPVNSHKSITITESTVRGFAGHSSQPSLGANALVHAAKMIASLSNLAGLWSKGTEPVSLRTLNPGTIQGGLAPNIIPDFCRFQWDLRQHGEDSFQEAWEDINAVLEKIRQDHGKCSVSHEQLVSVAGLAPEGNQKFAEYVRELSGHHSCHAVNYLTEAGLFQEAGMESVVWGPGDIAQAHQTDEYLERSQFARCQELLSRMVASL